MGQPNPASPRLVDLILQSQKVLLVLQLPRPCPVRGRGAGISVRAQDAGRLLVLLFDEPQGVPGKRAQETPNILEAYNISVEP